MNIAVALMGMKRPILATTFKTQDVLMDRRVTVLVYGDVNSDGWHYHLGVFLGAG